MKAEYVNMFIEATRSVLKTLINTELEIGKIYLKESTFYLNQITIMVGVTGGIRGQVFFEISADTAVKIASTMMGGIPQPQLDEIGKSAITEMANMIMGNTCTLLAGMNVDVDITPPTLLMGEKIRISNKNKTVGIPLKLEDYGTMIINITAEEII